MGNLGLLKKACILLAILAAGATVVSSQTFTNVIRFDSNDGSGPRAPIQATDGNFYAHSVTGQQSRRFVGATKKTDISGTKQLALVDNSGNPLFFPVVGYGSYSNSGNGLAIADLNGDGKPDLMAISRGSFGTVVTDGSVDTFLGNGDGTLRNTFSYDSGGVYGYSIAVGDLDGNGTQDVVVADGCASGTSGVACSPEGIVGVLMGNGNGTLQPVVTYSSGGFGLERMQVVVIDVNGDNKPDIIVSNCGPSGSCGTGVAGVLLGNGDGTFQSAVSYETGGYHANRIAVSDVNGDGKPDIIVANSCSGSTSCSSDSSAAIGVLLGNGDGTFQPALTFASGGQYGLALAVKDVNGDGKPDVIVGNCESGGCGGGEASVSVLLGKGDGTFQPAASYPAVSVLDIAVSDINEDGKLDLVVASWAGAVGILLGNGDGTFQAEQTYSSGGQYPETVTVSDLNGDRWPDVVVGNDCSSSCGPAGPLGVLINAGTHIFTNTTLSASPNPSIIGQAVTLTAVVSAYSGTAVGTVRFSNGSTTLGSKHLVNGKASFVTSALPLGINYITATYQGSADFVSSSSSMYQGVNLPPTATSLIPSADPSAVGQSVTYTATVRNETGNPLTGTMGFNQDGKHIANVPLVNNQATYTISYTKPGYHYLNAAYSGDVNNASSVSAMLNQVIATLPIPSKTVVSSSASTSLVGVPVTFKATVTWSYGTVPDGESVTFEDGGVAIGAAVTSGGIATFTTSSLLRKTHTIKAVYAGDASFRTSSGSVTQIVQGHTTTTTVSCSPNPSSSGQPVLLTALVASTGTTTPSGSVTFYNGTSPITTVTVDSTGSGIL